MTKIKITSTLSLLALVGGCSADVEDPHDGHDHNHGLPTSIVLNFTPADGGDALSFKWALLEGDETPQVDEILLDTQVTDYEVTVEIWNEDDDPAEDLTPDILADAAYHQLFFTGSAVDGPATLNKTGAVLGHDYADLDDNGLPVGLENDMQVLGAGEGELHVMLRHLPMENDEAVKVAGMAETVAEVGFSGIGGDVDVDISFPVIVIEK
jgi:hypothetical protein